MLFLILLSLVSFSAISQSDDPEYIDDTLEDFTKTIDYLSSPLDAPKDFFTADDNLINEVIQNTLIGAGAVLVQYKASKVYFAKPISMPVVDVEDFLKKVKSLKVVDRTKFKDIYKIDYIDSKKMLGTKLFMGAATLYSLYVTADVAAEIFDYYNTRGERIPDLIKED